MREEFYAGLEDRKYLTLAEAQKKALAIDWAAPGARARPTPAGSRPAQLKQNAVAFGAAATYRWWSCEVCFSDGSC